MILLEHIFYSCIAVVGNEYTAHTACSRCVGVFHDARQDGPSAGEDGPDNVLFAF